MTKFKSIKQAPKKAMKTIPEVYWRISEVDPKMQDPLQKIQRLIFLTVRLQFTVCVFENAKKHVIINYALCVLVLFLFFAALPIFSVSTQECENMLSLFTLSMHFPFSKALRL